MGFVALVVLKLSMLGIFVRLFLVHTDVLLSFPVNKMEVDYQKPSEYELKRLQRIKENHAFMKSLGKRIKQL